MCTGESRSLKSATGPSLADAGTASDSTSMNVMSDCIAAMQENLFCSCRALEAYFKPLNNADIESRQPKETRGKKTQLMAVPCLDAMPACR